MNDDIYNLPKIIFNDVINIHKQVLILLIIITVFSILIITTVHKTRLLIAQGERLNIIQKKAEIEWNNLILERNLLSSHRKIEKNAIEKLNMIYINPLEENIFSQ
ncbi:MAG: cell division protein FtsL [Buchnera aphidicola (Kaburagia rhusicola rhusicola)]